jgi:SAM-dependent methyltransferase
MMNRQEIIDLYDDAYAASYEQKFILAPLAKSDTDFELQLLRRFLRSGATWLDVACGTGYYLRHFPEVERAGIDLSPAMLKLARRANPGATLLQHDFRDAIPAWNDCWGLVSCMWYAYGLVNTVTDLQAVVRNLASWTAPQGKCFIPLADPKLIAGINLPYRVASPWQGEVVITGILWSYLEDGGRKVHSQLIAPSVEFMIAQLALYFRQVDIIRYPPAFAGWDGRPALVASGKKPG